MRCRPSSGDRGGRRRSLQRSLARDRRIENRGRILRGRCGQPASRNQATGQVFTQTYLPWTGTLNPRWARNYAVYRHHMLGLVKSGHRPGRFWYVYLVLVLIGSIGDIFPVLLGSLFGDGLGQVFMVSRDSLAHVLGFFPRNVLYYPWSQP